MKNLIAPVLCYLLTATAVSAQLPESPAAARNAVQVSQSDGPAAAAQARELKIPAGTPLEIGCAYTVSSLDVHPEDLISFRVLVPIKVDGVTVIEKDSLVTGRVLEAKRGGHWGKAGKLSWMMQDVVATDLTRVPLQAQSDSPGKNRTTGTSHGGQVATQMIVVGALMPLVAPLALMAGFKRGENAILPEGKRFIVFVKTDTVVHGVELKAGGNPVP